VIGEYPTSREPAAKEAIAEAWEQCQLSFVRRVKGRTCTWAARIEQMTWNPSPLLARAWMWVIEGDHGCALTSTEAGAAADAALARAGWKLLSG